MEKKKKNKRRISIYRGINIGIWQTRPRLMLISRDTSDVSTNIYMISGQHLLDSLCTLIFAYTTVDGELTLRGGWSTIETTLFDDSVGRSVENKRVYKLLNFLLFFSSSSSYLLLLLYFPYRTISRCYYILYGLTSIDLYSQNDILFTPL